MALCFADGILSFADGDIEYLLGKLDRIARTFGHEKEYATWLHIDSTPLEFKLRHYRKDEVKFWRLMVVVKGGDECHVCWLSAHKQLVR